MEKYLSRINEAIERLPLEREPRRLYEPVSYTMAGGGKRLRPVLTLMTCDALGGSLDEALPVALGIEMFHNFTLLHDAVMDRADVRRGRPTVHRRWNDNVAILSGDAMLTLATQLVAQAPRRCLPEVLDLFNATAMEIYEGQQWDMYFESRDDVTIDEYMNMIRLKTSVLLGCACKAGAIVAGADAALADRFYSMAVDLGLAFQLQDDYLDVWGDPATFGKAIGGDIECGKKTFLLIHALERDGEVRRLIAGDSADKVERVRAAYERLGLKELIIEAIEEHTRRCQATLASLGLAPEWHDKFNSLTLKLAHRQS